MHPHSTNPSEDDSDVQFTSLSASYLPLTSAHSPLGAVAVPIGVPREESYSQTHQRIGVHSSRSHGRLTNINRQGLFSISPPDSLPDCFQPRHSVDIDLTLYPFLHSQTHLFNQSLSAKDPSLISPSYGQYYSPTSSPETPVSFRFSPPHYHHPTPGSKSNIAASSPQSHFLSRGRQDSIATTDTVMTSPTLSCALSTPSTSYNYSQMHRLSLNDDGAPLFREDDGEGEDDSEPLSKGKGKAKMNTRTRSPSPLPSPPHDMLDLPPIEECDGILGLSFTESGEVVFPRADGESRGQSGTPPNLDAPAISSRNRRPGLSFSEQRFDIPTSPAHTIHPLVTPYPDGSIRLLSPGPTHASFTFSPSAASPQPVRQPLGRRRSVLLSLLRATGKGKSKREKKKSGSPPTNLIPQDSEMTSSNDPQPSTIANNTATPVSNLTHLMTSLESPILSSAVDRITEAEDLGTSHSPASSSSGESTIRMASSALTIREPQASFRGTSSAIIQITAASEESNRLERTNAAIGSTLNSEDETHVQTIPMSSHTLLQPPRLRYVGRANTTPSIASAQLTSTTVEGTSSRPSTRPSTPALSEPTAIQLNRTISSPIASASYSPSHPSILSELPPNISQRVAPGPAFQISSSAPAAPAMFNPARQSTPQTLAHLDVALAKDRFRVKVGGGRTQVSNLSLSNPDAKARAAALILQELSPPLPLPEWNYFDTLLPYELRIEVFKTLVRLHVAEYDRLVENEEWSFGMAIAGSGGNRYVKESMMSARWVGVEKGIRELVKLGRVCWAWQRLSLDGQLWSTTSFAPFPTISIPLLLRMTKTIGPFMRVLDLSGRTGITTSILIEFIDNMAVSREAQPSSSDLAQLQASLKMSETDSPPPSPHEIPSPLQLKAATTQLTVINLKGCTSLTSRSLHHLLVSSPLVQSISLTGLNAVTNTTCEIIGEFCSAHLEMLDLSRCWNMNAAGLQGMIGHRHIESMPTFTILPAQRLPNLKILKLGGLRRTTHTAMFYIAYGIPDLEVLDLGGAKHLRDDEVAALTQWDPRYDDPSVYNLFGGPLDKVTLTSREMGLNPMSADKYHKRLSKLRHICLTSCSLLTDTSAAHLSFAVPKLEFFEIGGIGSLIRDNGLVRLFATTPFIKRIDLEDASEITDTTLEALIPEVLQPPPNAQPGRPPKPAPTRPGDLLESIILSYAGNISDNAFLALIRSCPKLTVMEVDNTRISDSIVKEFIKTCRQGGRLGAEIVAVDCRNVSRNVVGDNNGPSTSVYATRNRRGLRSWDARTLAYYDERDRKDPSSGVDVLVGTQAVGDECDPRRVVLKTFHTWQAVDNMVAAREKRRKALASKRLNGTASGSTTPSAESSSPPRWLQWRSSSTGAAQAQFAGTGEFDFEDERSCTIM